MIQKIVRVDVDTQHGFCHPKGGLYVQGAEAVLPVVARLNAQAEQARAELGDALTKRTGSGNREPGRLPAEAKN